METLQTPNHPTALPELRFDPAVEQAIAQVTATWDASGHKEAFDRYAEVLERQGKPVSALDNGALRSIGLMPLDALPAVDERRQRLSEEGQLAMARQQLLEQVSKDDLDLKVVEQQAREKVLRKRLARVGLATLVDGHYVVHSSDGLVAVGQGNLTTKDFLAQNGYHISTL